jgi:hypothetical protein
MLIEADDLGSHLSWRFHSTNQEVIQKNIFPSKIRNR